MKSFIVLSILFILITSKCSHKKKSSLTFKSNAKNRLKHKNKYINKKVKGPTNSIFHSMKNIKRVMTKQVHQVRKPSLEISKMKKQLKISQMRRLKKKKEEKKEEEDGDEATKAAADPAAPAAADAAAPVPPKDLIREGWLKIHAESLLDEQTYPELLQERTEFQKKDKKLKIEVDEEENNLRKNPKNKDLHYFRLTKENLWYTETQADPVVLGSVAVKNIKAVEKGDTPECIQIEDSEEDMWILCMLPKEEEPKEPPADAKEPPADAKEPPADAKEPPADAADPAKESGRTDIEEWECELLKLIGEECEDEGEGGAGGGGAKVEIQIKREIIKQPLIIIPLPSLDCATDWGYSQNGADWLCKCNEGFNQSPIDIPPPVKNFVEFAQVQAQFEFNTIKKEDIEIIFETNLLRIRSKDKEKDIISSIQDPMGNLLNAYEIQIHTPGEHTLNGHKYAMEVQIHHDAAAGDFKRKAVLSFLFEAKAGINNGFWDTVDVMDLPTADNPKGHELIKQDFNVYQMMFETLEKAIEHKGLPFNYFTYEGSLTSPGCDEFVTWYIADVPFAINNVALEFMKDSTFESDHCSPHKYLPTFFTGTNRKQQPIHDRVIHYYQQKSYCGPTFDSVRAEEGNDNSEGHYEKVEKTQTKYYFVKGQEPSGMEGALVVSGEEEEEIKKQHKGE